MNIFWSRVRLEVEYFLYHETRRLIISLLHCNLVSLSFISFWQKVISHFMKNCISHSVKLISHAQQSYTYRVSRQVLDSLIECDNPIGLWWVWVAYPKTTIPYQDGCLPQPSGTKPFLKNPNNCYSPNNLNNCYNPNNFSHFGHYIFQRQLINQVNVGMGGGTQYHGTMVPQDYTKN